jgi:hypothetical protein
MHLYNIGVSQTSNGLCLTTKRFHRLLGQMSQKHLHSDLRLEMNVLTQIDLCKATLPQSLYEAIVTQALPRKVGTLLHLVSPTCDCTVLRAPPKCRGCVEKRQMSSHVREGGHSRPSFVIRLTYSVYCAISASTGNGDSVLSGPKAKIAHLTLKS